MMNIVKGKVPSAVKVVIYGPEGIGKSTLVSHFPDPVYIDTEGSTNALDIARFEPPKDWPELLGQIRYALDNPDTCKTLMIDTIDWAERMETDWLCNLKGWKGIEDAGYAYSAEEIGKMLDLLSQVVKKGVNVALVAHAAMRKVELPDEMGAYDHWELKTSKKVAPMIKEWADMVLFVNYKTRVISVDGKNKAQGGARMMYSTHTPYYDAKNRYGLPDEMPLDYEAIRPVIEQAVASLIDRLHKMMIEDQVTDEQLRKAVADKNHYAEDVPIEEYSDRFIRGWVIKYWNQIKELINQNNLTQED